MFKNSNSKFDLQAFQGNKYISSSHLNNTCNPMEQCRGKSIYYFVYMAGVCDSGKGKKIMTGVNLKPTITWI